MVARFEVEEVFVADDRYLALSLGFISSHSDLDILHFVTSRDPHGKPELYVERTDQALSCTGQVLQLARDGAVIVLQLMPDGAHALELEPVIHFGFDQHPELLEIAGRQLELLAGAGLDGIVRP